MKAKLPRGKQTFAKVLFFVGESFIVLGSKRWPTMPDKIKGIVVGAKANRTHILHGSCSNTVPDDTLVGQYVVNFDDKTKETIDLVYGKDVRNWWSAGNERATTRQSGLDGQQQDRTGTRVHPNALSMAKATIIMASDDAALTFKGLLIERSPFTGLVILL